MAEICLHEPDRESGYSEAAHIKALMYFPDDDETRQRYWLALRRNAVIADLEDSAQQHGWPIRLHAEQFDALKDGVDPDSVVTAAKDTAIRNGAFIAAHCLRYYVQLAVHHGNEKRLDKLREIKTWAYYYGAIDLGMSNRNLDRSSTRGKFVGQRPAKDEKSLRLIRNRYLPVAHFWLAAFDLSGGESNDIGGLDIDRLIGLAEGYRLLAEKHGVYAMALRTMKPDAVFKVATHLDDMDHDTGRRWREPIYDLTVIEPKIAPLAPDTLQALRRFVEE